jgi:hypothetical protein
MPPDVHWLFALFLQLSEAFNGMHPVMTRLIGWLTVVGFRGFWMILKGHKQYTRRPQRTSRMRLVRRCQGCTRREYNPRSSPAFQMRISILGRPVLEISLQRV